jgi:cobalt-zinc-cadmium efflux system protein
MPDLPHGEGEAERRVLNGLRLAVELSVVILLIEAVGAYFSRSLSLTVDAVHNVPDILAFAVSWVALAGTRAGSSDEFTFGTHRREVFAGVLNGLLVLGTGAFFGYAALVALASHGPFAGPVDALWLLAAAIPTLSLRAVNLAVLGRIPGRVRDMNLASVVVHIASDLVITVALLGAGITLLVHPSYVGADEVAALVIAALLVYESYPLLRDGWDVLTEKTPRKLSIDAIRRAALDVPGVSEVHDVHVWAVCSALVCMTAHVGVRDMSVRDSMGVLHALRSRMANEFGILHATFEIEAYAPH